MDEWITECVMGMRMKGWQHCCLRQILLPDSGSGVFFHQFRPAGATDLEENKGLANGAQLGCGNQEPELQTRATVHWWCTGSCTSQASRAHANRPPVATGRPCVRAQSALGQRWRLIGGHKSHCSPLAQSNCTSGRPQEPEGAPWSSTDLEWLP